MRRKHPQDQASLQERREKLGPLVGRKYLKLLGQHLTFLRTHYAHPNRVLYYDDVLTVYLLAFFNATVRSLRTLEDASRVPGVAALLSVSAVCKSTLSDANALFDPALLLPLIQRLREQLPGSPAHAPDDLENDPEALFKRIVAFDSSVFDLAADVHWAILTTHHGQTTGQMRLNLHYATEAGIPECASVSGHEGSESAAAALHLKPGDVLVADRGVFAFRLLTQAQQAGAHFVLRVKSNIAFTPEKDRPIPEAASAAGVVTDRIGHMPGSPDYPGPKMALREVIIQNPEKPELPVRLITDLLEVPAPVIGAIYQQRWQIELFFRWLKVHANLRHLSSHSKNGVTLSFYITLIATLLTCLYSGEKVSKYAYNLLGMAAAGLGNAEDMLPILQRRQRERALEKARLSRKKAAKNKG